MATLTTFQTPSLFLYRTHFCTSDHTISQGRYKKRRWPICVTKPRRYPRGLYRAAPRSLTRAHDTLTLTMIALLDLLRCIRVSLLLKVSPHSAPHCPGSFKISHEHKHLPHLQYTFSPPSETSVPPSLSIPTSLSLFLLLGALQPCLKVTSSNAANSPYHVRRING